MANEQQGETDKRKLAIEALATDYITLGEMIARVYAEAGDDSDAEELATLVEVRKAAFGMVDVARLRKILLSHVR